MNLDQPDAQGLCRQIYFRPAYDLRPKTPKDPNYGIHGMEISFQLWTPDRDIFVCWEVNTQWMPDTVEGSWKSHGMPYCTAAGDAYGKGVCVHCVSPLYEGHDSGGGTCEYLGGRPCFTSSYSEYEEKTFRRFVAEGEVPVWERLGQVMAQTQKTLREEREMIRNYS